MSVMLVLLAFILILVGVAVQLHDHDSGVKFTVSWTTAIAALVLVLFAAKVYFS